MILLEIALISAALWGAVTEGEAAFRFHGVFLLLPMSIEMKDRCE